MPKGFRKMAVYLGLVEDNQNYLDEEIEEFVKEHADAKIEFTKIAEAREYRETMTVLEQLDNIIEHKEIESKFPETLLD